MSACLLMWCFQLRIAKYNSYEFSCFLRKGYQGEEGVHTGNVSGTGAEHEALRMGCTSLQPEQSDRAKTCPDTLNRL